MTTKEAFLQLVSKRKWYAGLNISEGAAWTLAKRVRDGELISLDKMEEVLAMAGYQVVSEKVWAEPGAAVTTDIKKINASATRIDPDAEIFLIDKPENYWSGFVDWNFLHNHMYPENTSYEDMLKYYDLYLLKLEHQKNG
jgi:hypothetical protein